MIERRFLTTLSILTWTLGIYAQFGKLFTSDDRLSSSLINDIKQDCNGFVLIATQDGLNVFDGHTMHIYQKGITKFDRMSNLFLNASGSASSSHPSSIPIPSTLLGIFEILNNLFARISSG